MTGYVKLIHNNSVVSQSKFYNNSEIEGIKRKWKARYAKAFDKAEIKIEFDNKSESHVDAR